MTATRDDDKINVEGLNKHVAGNFVFPNERNSTQNYHYSKRKKTTADYLSDLMSVSRATRGPHD